jgi:hypothetical protein
MSTASRHWNRSSKRLAILFLVVLVPSAATLIWLGVRLLDQYRRLWADRDRERRGAAAEIFVRELSQALVSIDLTPGGAPEGVVLAKLSAAAVTAQPSSGVLWSPAAQQLPEANARVFIDAETAESRQTGDRGLAAYISFSRSSDPAIRAGALWRLARLQLTSGKVATALNTYRQLADVTGVAVNGMPVDLFARRPICRLLEESTDKAALATEAQTLREYLMAGRWVLDRTAWEIAREDIERWTGAALEVPAEKQALAETLEWLSHEQFRNDTFRDAQKPADVAYSERMTSRFLSNGVLRVWRRKPFSFHRRQQAAGRLRRCPRSLSWPNHWYLPTTRALSSWEQKTNLALEWLCGLRRKRACLGMLQLSLLRVRHRIRNFSHVDGCLAPDWAPS